MKNFDYQTPTRLIFGRDVVAGLPEVMRPFGRRILLTYGGGSIYLPHNFFPKLRQLREEKYDLKFKQRLIALIAGDIVWVLAYWIERVIMGN